MLSDGELRLVERISKRMSPGKHCAVGVSPLGNSRHKNPAEA